jgi:hypothetical protein
MRQRCRVKTRPKTEVQEPRTGMGGQTLPGPVPGGEGEAPPWRWRTLSPSRPQGPLDLQESPGPFGRQELQPGQDPDRDPR